MTLAGKGLQMLGDTTFLENWQMISACLSTAIRSPNVWAAGAAIGSFCSAVAALYASQNAEKAALRLRAEEMLSELSQLSLAQANRSFENRWLNLRDVDTLFQMEMTRAVFVEVRLQDLLSEIRDKRVKTKLGNIAESDLTALYVYQNATTLKNLTRTKRVRKEIEAAIARHNANLARLPRMADGTPDLGAIPLHPDRNKDTL